VLRLVNMNLEPFVIASSLRLIVAQRLIRRLCGSCKAPVRSLDDLPAVQREMVARADLPAASAASFFEPVGCPACGGTGYRGRTGIFEVLRVTPSIEDLILARPSVSAVRARARLEGMRTLRDAGLLKAMAGETSLAEVLQHTIGEDEPPPGTASADATAGGGNVTAIAGRR
jgi:type II secretory ATPase GspE/PulE/Tfp pilus assembly ATPase PilB-like protein